MGRFSIQRELGRGEFAIVYQARDRENGSTLALKLLDRHAVKRVGLDQLRREFAAASQLSHPNLGRHYELLRDGSDWFITMELVEGRDFVEHVRRDLPRDSRNVEQASRTAFDRAARAPRRQAFSGCGPDGVKRIRDALPGLISGVSALHAAGLVHRDLQSANVRVTFVGRVVVLDYGLTVALRAPTTEHSGPLLVGNPINMAPEQWDPDTTGPATDWYAVGLMLFEALVGVPPFSGSGADVTMRKRTVPAPRPSELVRAIPPDLDHLVAQLLLIDPRQRPTGAELARAFGGNR